MTGVAMLIVELLDGLERIAEKGFVVAMLVDQIFQTGPGPIHIRLAAGEKVIMAHDFQGEAAGSKVPKHIEETDSLIFEAPMGTEALLEAETLEVLAALLHRGRPGADGEDEKGDHDCQSERVHGISKG